MDHTLFALDHQLHILQSGCWNQCPSDVRDALCQYTDVVYNLRHGVLSGKWDERVMHSPAAVLFEVASLGHREAASVLAKASMKMGRPLRSEDHPLIAEMSQRSMQLKRFKRKMVDAIYERARSAKRPKI